jgi:hypothetical protein
MTPIDRTQLARVMGGAGENTDITQSRLGVARVYGLPIPYRKTTTKQSRTEYGACLDRNVAECDRAGGRNETVGTCMLDGIDRCPQPKESR